MHIGPQSDRNRVLNRVCFGARLCAQLWAEMYAQFGVQFGVLFCCGTPKWKEPMQNCQTNQDPNLDPKLCRWFLLLFTRQAIQLTRQCSTTNSLNIKLQPDP